MTSWDENVLKHNKRCYVLLRSDAGVCERNTETLLGEN